MARRAAIRTTATLAALTALLLLSASPAAAKPAAASAVSADEAVELGRQAQQGAAKAARFAAEDAAKQGGHPGRTAGEATAAEAGREAMAIKLARGPLAPGGTRTALEALSRSDNAAEAALACAAEWAQCGTEAERGELLTVSCELGDEDAFCFEGYLADALVQPEAAAAAVGDHDGSDHPHDVAVFRCRRDEALSTASSACAAPSASWTRTSTGGIGHRGATAFSASSRTSSSGDPAAALEAYQRIAAQAERMRAGLLDVARLGGLAAPAGGFGGNFDAMLAEDPLGPMGGMAFGMA
jgi:hypothetical protein